MRQKRYVAMLLILCLCSVYVVAHYWGIKMDEKVSYQFPFEDQEHEGTWLTWPHEYTYGKTYLQEVEGIWIQMTQALQEDENVHIIAYDEKEKERIYQRLRQEGISLDRIDFTIAKSDDVWVRDTGPIFVYDQTGQKKIMDFHFNGWGEKMTYEEDDRIPQEVSKKKNIPLVDAGDLTLEGGAVELDGSGVLLATKSAVHSKNRNRDLSLEEVENKLMTYLGAKKFIWLEGSEGEDITDAHIDGLARFYDDKTILTLPRKDFLSFYEGIPASDYERLMTATNMKEKTYRLVTIPLTAEDVVGTDYRGSYLNYYLGNKVLLLPIYGDANDQQAINQFQDLYPNRRVVPIQVASLYKYGGMIHCVTQQEPYNVSK